MIWDGNLIVREHAISFDVGCAHRCCYSSKLGRLPFLALLQSKRGPYSAVQLFEILRLPDSCEAPGWSLIGMGSECRCSSHRRRAGLFSRVADAEGSLVLLEGL